MKNADERDSIGRGDSRCYGYGHGHGDGRMTLKGLERYKRWQEKREGNLDEWIKVQEEGESVIRVGIDV